MTACEKCWEEARLRSLNSGKSTTDEYQKLLDERRDNPCSPEDQHGGPLGAHSPLGKEGPSGPKERFTKWWSKKWPSTRFEDPPPPPAKPKVVCYIPAGVVMKQLNALSRELSHTSSYSPHRQYLERAIEDHKCIMAHKEFIAIAPYPEFSVKIEMDAQQREQFDGT